MGSIGQLNDKWSVPYHIRLQKATWQHSDDDKIYWFSFCIDVVESFVIKCQFEANDVDQWIVTPRRLKLYFTIRALNMG